MDTAEIDPMSMATTEYDDPATIWHRRAEAVGFRVWKGKETAKMTEKEIEAAFDGLSREYGASYVWN